MAVQRVPQDEPEQPRPELRLVHSTATPAEAQASNPSKGILIGLVISMVGFWGPIVALAWRWLR
jgi:hypothetical protein